MDHDKELRSHIVNLLKGGQAYMPFDTVIADFPREHMNTAFPNGTYSPWHLLEHIRRTQFDILEFMKNPDYKEREWPKDYWPVKDDKAAQKDWEKTISGFQKDRNELEKMVMDQKLDLFKKVPWGDGQTYLREFLLVADHNSYHLGEFSIMRQVMGTWKK